MRRIGWLDQFPESDPNAQRTVKAFNQIIAKMGWAVGRNLTIDYRWGLFDAVRARAAGAELLPLAPDVFVCGGTPATLAMQEATRIVPIVFAVVTDPVAQGIVTNLARPAGNITGFTYLEQTMGAKWLELLKEIAPSVKRGFTNVQPEVGVHIPAYFSNRSNGQCRCGGPFTRRYRSDDDKAWGSSG